MGLLIIEPRSKNKVPGTVTILERSQALDELDIDPATLANKSNLKYRDGFLLVPQPSDDPNDPLNWSRRKRDGILAVLCLLAVIATTLSPILAATSFSLLFVFDVAFTDIALLTGYHLLGVGIGGILFVPSSRIWGKRHAYLIGSIIVIVTSVWGGVAGRDQDFKSFLWARIFQGVGLAPFEALVNASVGDLFFVHERGKRMALTTICLFGSSFFAPVIVGVIATRQGFQWSFYWVAILMSIFFPLLFFCAPETAFVRSAQLNNDFGDGKTIEKQENSGQAVAHHGGRGEPANLVGQNPDKEAMNTNITSAPESDTSTADSPVKRSYARGLLPFSGRKTEESYFKLFFRPFPLFLHPGVLWACITQGLMIGWTVFIGIILAAIFELPPLYFDDEKVGYLFSSAFIGSIIGFILSGIVADPLANFLTKRNKGVYEPEFRIPLVALQLFFGAIGLYGFGFTADNITRYGWVGPDVFFGFVIAGMVCGAVASALYLVDAHREIAIESFTCMMMFKNIFSFALTFKGYDWLQQSGPKRVFVAIGSVQVAICALSLAMYIFGKVNRSFWARHDILALFRLR